MKKQFFTGNDRMTNTNEYPETVILLPFRDIMNILDCRNCNVTTVVIEKTTMVKISPITNYRSPFYPSITIRVIVEGFERIDKWHFNQSWHHTEEIYSTLKSAVASLMNQHDANQYVPDL